jgi:hypothetical protein
MAWRKGYSIRDTRACFSFADTVWLYSRPGHTPRVERSESNPSQRSMWRAAGIGLSNMVKLRSWAARRSIHSIALGASLSCTFQALYNTMSQWHWVTSEPDSTLVDTFIT